MATTLPPATTTVFTLKSAIMDPKILMAILVGITFVLVSFTIFICCCCGFWKKKPRPVKSRAAKSAPRTRKAQGKGHGQHVATAIGGQAQFHDLENRPQVIGNNYDIRGYVPPPPSLSTQVTVGVVGPLDDQIPFNASKLLEATIIARTLSRVRVDTDRLHLDQPIGRGQFGLVYKGQLLDKNKANPQEVAVKTVHGDKCETEHIKAFMEEVMMMRDFDHPNVMTMLGLIIKDNKPYVCLPFMHHGDLKGFISEPQRSFQLVELLQLGLQVAQGMHYLAKENFVHRDLAARNCMVDKDHHVKVADFGLSRDLYEGDYYRMEDMAYPLPVRWMSVESIFGKTYNSHSDVWAFGVLLWELMTRGQKPYSDIADNKDVTSFIKRGGRMHCPASTSPEIYDIMTSCWKTTPTERPTFAELCDTLGSIVSSVQGDYEDTSHM